MRLGFIMVPPGAFQAAAAAAAISVVVSDRERLTKPEEALDDRVAVFWYFAK